MSRPTPLPAPLPGRLLGLYALSVMEREGPVYGYLLSERVSQRTDGAWHPGPGAVYPALERLRSQGFARAARHGRRRLYTISPLGRAQLARIRRQWVGVGRQGPDLGVLWSEIAGAGDPGQHLLRRLRRHLEAIATYLERDPEARAGKRPLREQVLAELGVTKTRLDSLLSSTRRSRRIARGG